MNKPLFITPQLLKVVLCFLTCILLLGCKSNDSESRISAASSSRSISHNAQQNTESNVPIKIGAIASLSGPAAEQGSSWLDGARLALHELIQEGANIELIVEDDATTPSKVASAFQKLASVDKVYGIIGGTWDFLAEVAYPLALRLKTPFITPTNPAEILPKAQDNPYVFASGLSFAAEKLALKLLFNELRIKKQRQEPYRVGVLYSNIPYGQRRAVMLRELMLELNLQSCIDQEFTFEGYPDNLRVIALRLPQAKCDLVLAVLDYAGVDLLAAEVERLKLNINLVVQQHLESAFNLNPTRSLYKSAYGVYPKVKSIDFAQRFMAYYNRAPKVHAAEGYDALRFLVQLKSENFEFLNSDRKSSVYHGLMGQYIIRSFNSEIVKTDATIMSTNSGQFKEFALGYSWR